jgi:hypothetical protein
MATTVAGREDEARGRQTALDRELGKGAAWDLGEWDTGEWASPLLDYLLLAAIQAPKRPEQAELLEKLSWQPLLVARWVAVPKVRRKVTALGHTPEGRIVLDVVVPILCHFALRLAWDDLAPQPQANLHQLAHALHTRATTLIGRKQPPQLTLPDVLSIADAFIAASLPRLLGCAVFGARIKVV